MTVAGGSHGDVRRAPAEELLEGAHILEPDPVLEGVDVDTGPAHRDQVVVLLRTHVQASWVSGSSEPAMARMWAIDARTSATGSTPVSSGAPMRMVSCSSTYQPV